MVGELMTTWVTSDTHFGHARILELCPWRKTWAKDIEEHDAKLIARWNDTVKPEDTVFHLGDFALCSRLQLGDTRARLHGTIVLIRGNHDRGPKSMTDLGFIVCEGRTVQVSGRVVSMVHDPSGFVDLGLVDVLLHGHWHGDDHRDTSTVSVEHRHKLVDVGIDARMDIRPANLEELVARHVVQ